MRWPWSRRPAEPDPPEAAKHAFVAPAPPAMGWAFLPPIQRRIAAPTPSITRPRAFPAELPAWRSPAFTGPATHAVVDVAPGGVIDADGGGLGQPTPSPVPAPELTLLPPPRPTRVQRTESAAPAAVPGRDPDPPPAQDPVDDRAPVLTRVGDGHLPVVQRVAVTDEPTHELSDAQSAEDAEPSVSAAVDAEVPVDAAAGPPIVRPDPPAPTVRVQRGRASSPPIAARMERPTSLGLGPPLPAIPDTATTTPPPAGAPSPLPLVGAEGFTEVPVQRSLGSTDQPSTQAKVQRSAEPPNLGAAGPMPDLALASPPTAPAESDAQDDVAAAHPVAGAVPPADAEPATTDAGEDHETMPEPGPSSDPAPPSMLVEPPPLASAPLPLATGMPTTIQRSTGRSTPAAPVPGRVVRRVTDLAPRSDGRVVPVQRIRDDLPATLPPSPASAPPERLPGASSGRPAAVASVGPTRVQRGFLAAALHRGTPSSASTSSPRRAVVAAAGPTRVQRGFLTAAFHRVTGSPAAGTREPEAGVEQLDVPLPILAAEPRDRVGVQRAPAEPPADLLEHAVGAPLRAAATTAPPPPVAVNPVPTVVQREMRDAGPLPLPPTQAPTTVPVQAAPADDGPSIVTEPVPPATTYPAGPAPVVARAGEPAVTPATTSGPAGAAPGGAADVDALAQRLFTPMLRRIKAELLLDRERRGMRTDAW